MQLWFYAIYLMSSTRCGISAKQLEREIGVTYKTAHRMFKQIRTLLLQDDELLDGEVEVDKTAGGGRVRASDTRRGHEFVVRAKVSRRPTIWGAMERGCSVRAKVVKSRGTLDVEQAIYTHVLPSSMIFTDEWKGYNPERIRSRYAGHHRIRHEDKIYVDGNVHTNTIEGFFGLLKNGIRGTCHSVSSTYLQSYLNEYAWRYPTTATTRVRCSGRLSTRFGSRRRRRLSDSLGRLVEIPQKVRQLVLRPLPLLDFLGRLARGFVGIML